MNIPGILTIPLHAKIFFLFICSILEALKPYIYSLARGGVEGRAKLTKKSTLQKEVLTETMKKNIT